VNAEEFSQWVLAGKRAMERPGYAASGGDAAAFQILVEASALKVIIPHHETFSTAIQPPYSSTKGWVIY
jgi:hypothetical protein